MKVSQLLEQLQELFGEGYGDLEIVDEANDDLSDVVVQFASDEDCVILKFN